MVRVTGRSPFVFHLMHPGNQPQQHLLPETVVALPPQPVPVTRALPTESHVLKREGGSDIYICDVGTRARNRVEAIGAGSTGCCRQWL